MPARPNSTGCAEPAVLDFLKIDRFLIEIIGPAMGPALVVAILSMATACPNSPSAWTKMIPLS